jgi:endonuclease YncB( thermonuclease family)
MAKPAVIVWDEARLIGQLRRRRKWVWAGRTAILLAVISIVLDRRADDWAAFDGRTVRFVSAADGEAINVRNADNGRVSSVRLLGIKARDSKSSRQSKIQLQSLLVGRDIILKLETPQTRDAQGRLLAYAFLDDRDLVNADLARQGFALADRQPIAFRGPIAQAEAQARHKHLGVWAAGAAALAAATPADPRADALADDQ